MFLFSQHFLEKELLESLPLSKLCTEEQELLRFLFENKLKKVSKNTKLVFALYKHLISLNLSSILSQVKNLEINFYQFSTFARTDLDYLKYMM